MAVLDLFRLDGAVTVVTGGTGLYGAPFARALAQAGATVVLTSRQLASAKEVAARLRADGWQVAGAELDQADPASINTFRDHLLDRYGRVDVLVNNAVHRQGGGWRDATAEDWDATSAVNSRGLFLMIQAMAPAMVDAGRGSIVNIGSIYGLVGPTFDIYQGSTVHNPAFYAYDKAGMVGLTRYFAAALGPSGVRVNCLCPGGLNARGDTGPFIDAYAAHTPLGRMAQADDVTGALVFLASEASRYVTGVTLPVDGGWTAH